jgi:hypothetical protein
MDTERTGQALSDESGAERAELEFVAGPAEPRLPWEPGAPEADAKAGPRPPVAACG